MSLAPSGWRVPLAPDPPPSDDPLPAPEDPGPESAPEPESGPEAEPGPEPEITDEPLPPPEDAREDEPALRDQQDPSEESVELDTEGEVFDCGLVDPGCHVSNWFADFVVSGLNPALGWLAQHAFYTPLPTEGMKALHSGILTTGNTLFVLLVVAGGLVVMGYQNVQSRYSAADILPRGVFAFVAANFSLWVTTEMVRGSNQISAAIGAQGIDAQAAATNFRDRLNVILEEAMVFTILLLVVVVVMLAVWMLTEAVRICMVIVLVIAGPLLLMFHALPHTNRIAELWWKCMVGLCAIPIAQSIVFIAMARLFFEGQMTIFGSLRETAASEHDPALVLDTGTGPESVTLASSVIASPVEGDVGDAGWLMNIMLLLVLLYVQIRISSWVMKLVWQPNPGTSPLAAMLKNIAWMMAFRSLGNVRMPVALREGFDLGIRRPQRGWPKHTPGKPLPRHTPTPSKGLQPLQSQAWWYRHRHDPPDPVGDLTTGGRRALPGPGSGAGPWPQPGPRPGGPPALPGQKALPPLPPPRTAPPAPARRVLEEGRMPGSPKVGQQTLFPLPTPSPKPTGSVPGSSPQRRWRQGVLPTPPPVRVPGRRAPERLGLAKPDPRPAAGLRHLPDMPAVTWGTPPHVKGQRPLFPNPKRVWKQYGLFPPPNRAKK
ncbi:hypothetical protein Q8791_17125 [Nocardiopsis sp. CT-R113]|uniref:TrbL/VirB6 plasmid conjugal transfer protein n=1 Tax=Nocardiopsis codii TaxID=3065942 RepID=A0ABU7K9N3_9ACTN|nr:hypothetical protein [Nocardiopsis sp. CT-R113]MEE2038943.1 hypothetical protein [Nocardiopsis sp. CT-R113]